MIYSNDVEKAYDVCTYQIFTKQTKKNDEERIFIKINKMENVKVFLYGGNYKYNPNISIIKDNQPALINGTYAVEL